ncbi:unnamed protein product [Brachionus calyciflorus]|uniref:Uncharacterized protein n=1 Tax=Brachionus calyciflorus TaxID=104777 RepID=A0A813XGF5_9BILA|nr:unnamed protein product [Brachionus calyciflorus]
MRILLILSITACCIFGTFAVICSRAERIERTITCHNSVFRLCETYGIRRACDHQLRQPATWRRGMNVYEACRRNQPPARYTAIGTFLREHDQYPFYHQSPQFEPHTALFMACGAWNSIIVMDQHTDNRTYSVWGTNTLMDRGHETTEYNARMYYVIERSHNY